MGLSGRSSLLGTMVAFIAGLMATSAHATPSGLTAHAKVRSDGVLTVGQQETIRVKWARPKLKLQAAVISAVVPRDCFKFFEVECTPQPLFRLAGTPRFQASRQGRAALTFVMPPAWEFIDWRNPIASHPVAFANGERIFIQLSGIIRKPRSLTVFGLGGTTAAVEVPPPPSS
jgi:hypothetical protein